VHRVGIDRQSVCVQIRDDQSGAGPGAVPERRGGTLNPLMSFASSLSASDDYLVHEVVPPISWVFPVAQRGDRVAAKLTKPKVSLPDGRPRLPFPPLRDCARSSGASRPPR
jgi:hypothetical protein